MQLLSFTNVYCPRSIADDNDVILVFYTRLPATAIIPLSLNSCNSILETSHLFLVSLVINSEDDFLNCNYVNAIRNNITYVNAVRVYRCVCAPTAYCIPNP